MTLLARVKSFGSALLFGRRVDRDMSAEWQFHVEARTADLVASGLRPAEAAAQARREFGDPLRLREDAREARGLRTIDDFRSDVVHAVRQLRRAPLVAAAAIVALAIGVGANTAIFTVLDAALIEPLPFKDPQRLVVVWEVNSRRPNQPNSVGPANYLRWRERTHVFDDLAGLVDSRMNLTGSGAPEEVIVENVTEGFFQALAVAPILGRTFSAAEADDPDGTTVVMAYALWQRRFGSDPSIIGQSIQLNGTPTTVVGVMPPDLRVVLRRSQTGKPPDLWRPWVLPVAAREPHGRFMSVVGRLKPGVSHDQAQADIGAVAAALRTELPKFDTGWSAQLMPIREELVGQITPVLLVLAGAVVFVLLIACANVANLLLARAAVRQREMAIRTALGAGRGRIVRQLLAESLVLAAAGGALALFLARSVLGALVAISPVDVAAVGHIDLNIHVLVFTGAVSLLTALLCGVAPAFDVARQDVQEALKDGGRQAGGRRSARLREAFVVAEVALALVLLIGAGLMLRSFATLRAVPSGLDTHGVLTARVSLPPGKYPDDGALRFFAETTDRLAHLPGVEAAGAISFLPFAGLGAATDFTIVGRPVPPPSQSYLVVVSVCDNGYFRALGIPLVRGRWFTASEQRIRSGVVIVNEALARRYFPGEDPIGQRLVIEMADKNEPTEIVGVVGDARFGDLRGTTAPQSYWPPPQLPYSAMTLTVRTASAPLSLAPAVAREIQEIDKDQPVSDVRTMDQWLARSLAQDRFTTLLLAVFAAVAAALAAIGIYAVMAYAVTQRTTEIGIRVALGAGRRHILAMVLLNAARLTSMGVALGLALAVILNRTMAGILYEVSPTDPITFAGVAALLTVVALAATYVPARRASRIAPAEMLHEL